MAEAATEPKKPAAPVYTDASPEFPKLLYNQKTRKEKSAANKEEEQKLQKDGFGEDPLPPLDPNALTADEVKEFQGLLAKVSKYVASLPTQQEQAQPKPTEKHNDKPHHA